MKMRSDQGWRKVAVYAATAGYIACLLLTAVFVGFRWVAVTSETATWIVSTRESALMALPLLAVGVAVFQPLRQIFGQPARWKAVKVALSALREQVFREEIDSGVPIHHHRVTLFKRTPLRLRICRFPWSGWLIPVERSGDGTRTTRTVFRLTDNPDLAEGVVGHSFYRETLLTVSGLPEITGESSTEELQEYARKTWCKLEYLKSRKPKSRSFVATRVLVNGNTWGVLVVDSIDPEPKTAPEFVVAYDLAARIVGAILARGG